VQLSIAGSQNAQPKADNMLIRRPPETSTSEITDEAVYIKRREFMKSAGGVAAGLALGPILPRFLPAQDEQTPFESVTSYNNFYEFGTGKEDPARNAHTLRTRPWTVSVGGEVNKPKEYGIEDILRRFPSEERVYRLRCVEAWSMVIPWLGFPLRDLLAEVEPTAKARFVAFETLRDPEQMPGQRRAIMDWPYVEGLRLDEAMHPLTILSTGLYGRMLPNQNGAPIRLVVPWKYGFKSIKSIVRISLVEDMPPTSWNLMIPHEYGFYANVNPDVDHPRWSQARERPIGKFRRIDTQMFNGYGDQVASMYAGMDLRRNY
jgi:sulfoxide reductase catalytic subunit YedY